MDPYGQVRTRVQSSNGRFWRWFDRTAESVAPHFNPVPSEPQLYVVDRAWLIVRPANWTRYLPLNRGRFGTVRVSDSRLVAYVGRRTVFSANVGSESFQSLIVAVADDGSCQITPGPGDGAPKSVVIHSPNAIALAAAIESARQIQQERSNAHHES